jgi:predicted secreted acid phosphatase
MKTHIKRGLIILILSAILVYLSACQAQKPDNKIINTDYNVQTNTISVIYIQNADTMALDFLHPIELDSLIFDLNHNK